MKLQRRDIRALALLVAGLIAMIVYRSLGSSPTVASPAMSADLPERQLNKLRLRAATLPGKEQALQAVQSQLRFREKGVLAFTTAAQAQAHILEVTRRLASTNKIEARGGDFSAPRMLGSDYGLVAVSINFECAIEQFVNFLADLSHEPELIAPIEVHISAGNAKNKTIQVRVMLAGAVPRALVPEKKGMSLL